MFFCSIHKIKDKNLLINPVNGKVLSIDDSLYSFLKEDKPDTSCNIIQTGFPDNKKTPVSQIIEKLIQGQYLAQHKGQFTEQARKNINNLKHSDYALKEGILLTTNNCNLSCSYCYEKNPETEKFKNNSMSKEVAIGSFEYILNNSRGFNNLLIHFMGGEPLLNMEVIESVCKHWKQIKPAYKNKNLNFYLISNGTLITEATVKFLKKHKIIVTISLDGGKEDHNKYRNYKNNKGSFDQVIQSLKLLSKYSVPYRLRSTITSRHDQKKILNFFKSVNIPNIVLTPVDFPVIKKKKDYQFDIHTYKRFYQNLYTIYEEGLNELARNCTQTFAIGQLKQLAKNLMVTTGNWALKCGAGWYTQAFDNNGDIYPCQRFAGKNQYIIGNIKDGLNLDKIKLLLYSLVDSSNACDTCWAIPFCKGRCLYEKLVSTAPAKELPSEVCDIYRDITLNQLYYQSQFCSLQNK